MTDATTLPAAPLPCIGRRRLVTRSVAVDAADALDRLGLATGSADAFLASGAWVALDRDRVRLVPVRADNPRAPHAFAIVETEHHNILAGDDTGPELERARAA